MKTTRGYLMPPPPQQHLHNGLARPAAILCLHGNGLTRTDSVWATARDTMTAGQRDGQAENIMPPLPPPPANAVFQLR